MPRKEARERAEASDEENELLALIKRIRRADPDSHHPDLVSLRAEALEALTLLEGNVNPAVAASASLALTTIATREGRIGDARVASERGLALLAPKHVRDGTGDVLHPELTARSRIARKPGASRMS